MNFKSPGLDSHAPKFGEECGSPQVDTISVQGQYAYPQCIHWLMCRVNYHDIVKSCHARS